MYAIDARDEVKLLDDLPQSSVGAPLPLLLAAENRLVVAHLVDLPDPGWDGSSARVVTQSDAGEPAARVENAVHPSHLPESYSAYRHFILAFHDSTFECVAKGYLFEFGTAPLDPLIRRAPCTP